MTERYEVRRLDEIERSGVRKAWIPIRRALGVAAFGVNAWSGEEGTELIPEHDEAPTGHEELYFVLDGQATFTVAGETTAEARLGETDAALDHLRHATGLGEQFAAYAQDDEDLASLRDDPRFPPAPAA